MLAIAGQRPLVYIQHCEIPLWPGQRCHPLLPGNFLTVWGDRGSRRGVLLVGFNSPSHQLSDRFGPRWDFRLRTAPVLDQIEQ
jgi:hypothetical protein